MVLDVAVLALGFVVLTIGAEGLVRGSSALAIRVGLTPLVVGLTVVSFGTSAPELVVSLGASLHNQGDIAVGNVVGSNIFNIGVILGLTALICPLKVRTKVVRQDGPLMMAASIILLIFLYQGRLSRSVGGSLLVLFAIYIAYNIRLARKESSSETGQQFSEGIAVRPKTLSLELIFICGGLLLLVIGSRLLVSSAIEIARYLGVSEAVIGLTIIATGTSIPELATSLVAALRRQPDIAVGNVVGSNIFNILGILGVSSLVMPITVIGVKILDLVVMVAFSIAILPLIYTGFRLQRWEGGLLLLGYAAYLYELWP